MSLAVLYQKFNKCSVFSVNVFQHSTNLHILMGKKKKKFAWKIPKHPDWLCIKECDSIMLSIPSLGCNLIQDLNNLSLLDKGSGSLPWLPCPH